MIERKRFLIQDTDGSKGSTTGFLTTFHNALNQVRQIAFDGVLWFVQEKNNKPFKVVSEGWVPAEVKERMYAFMKKRNT